MKRLFAVLLAVVLLLSTAAMAEKFPVMAKTKDGIMVVVKDARYDKDYTGESRIIFTVNVTNDTDKDYMITSVSGFVNGWEVDAHTYISIAAGMKKKDEVYVVIDDAEMHSAADVKKLTELKVKLAIFPEDDMFDSTRYATKKINVDWIKEKVAANAK